MALIRALYNILLSLLDIRHSDSVRARLRSCAGCPGVAHDSAKAAPPPIREAQGGFDRLTQSCGLCSVPDQFELAGAARQEGVGHDGGGRGSSFSSSPRRHVA